jgi:hypothetical protein
MLIFSSLVLGLFALASAQLNQISNVDYSVINLLNETHTMGVIVDNVTYRLTPNEKAPILYTGSAPAAKSGYRYVKITKENNNTEVEPFLRQPAKSSTPNEFFNRSWNKRDLAKLPVLYKPLDPINRISSDLHIDGQIPTIHFTGNQTLINAMHKNISSDADVKGNLTYISLNDTLTYENVEISLAGRSSRWMPKLSYNIKLKKKDRIYYYRRFKLRALATDPSYLREQLAYDSLKSVGLLSAEFTFCRVFMNDQELGLFGLIDTFQDPWLSNVFNGGEKYKNGYLYQGSFQTAESGKRNQISDLSYTSNISDYGLGQYGIKVKASKGEKDNYEPLMEFTKFIAEAPTNTSNAVEEWNKKLYTDSFLRS